MNSNSFWIGHLHYLYDAIVKHGCHFAPNRFSNLTEFKVRIGLTHRGMSREAFGSNKSRSAGFLCARFSKNTINVVKKPNVFLAQLCYKYDLAAKAAARKVERVVCLTEWSGKFINGENRYSRQCLINSTIRVVY